MSNYPPSADLYEVNGAIYRRPPYRGLVTQPNQLPAGTGDTADLYDDDDHEEESYANDDGPACGVEETANSGAGLASMSGVTKSLLATRNVGPPPGLLDSVPPGLCKVDPRVIREGTTIPKYTATIDVPAHLHGFLCGKNHETRREMEKATNCRIAIPDKSSRSTQIRIESTVGAENVSRCLDRIETMVHSREQQKPRWTKTHFLAVPCTFPRVQRRFNTFVDMVVNVSEHAHVSMKNKALFPDSAKLHVTIAMMSLQTDEDKEKARQAMAEVKEKYKDTKPIAMEIEGLDYMNDDPSEVHVLFGKIKNADEVQPYLDDVRQHFLRAGLLSKHEKDTEHVKLHMTVMNSRYAVKDDNYDNAANYRNRKPFDARTLLAQHYDFPFGFQDLDKLSICTLGTTDEETGFYECFLEEKIGTPIPDHPKFPTPVAPRAKKN